MDRRLARIATALVLGLLGCRKDASSSKPRPMGVDAHVPVLVHGAGPADAGTREPEAAPFRPEDVLHGPMAEQEIASGRARGTLEPIAASPAPGRGMSPASQHPLTITPGGVGPYVLDAPRAELLVTLHGKARLYRIPTSPGEPTVEMATVRGENGAPLLKLRVYAGRLSEVQVVGRNRGAMTDGGVQVGSSLDEVIEAHGEPRLVEDSRGRKLGWVMSELPGVVFVPADQECLKQEAPPAAAVVARILVLGPEATAED